MKNLKKLMTLAIITFIIQQTTTAYDKSADDAQPTHQGWGRLGTFVENNLTLHPLNSVNALATGDQSDTTYGWHKDDNDHIKANRAHTEHNRNKDVDVSNSDNQKQSKKQRQKNNDDNKKNKGHWFWKSDDSSNNKNS